MTAPIPELDLGAIKARADAATPGPWEAGERCVWQAGMLNTAEIAVDCEHGNGGIQRHVDAEFVAHARTDVPALLAEVKRLRERAEKEEQDASDLIGERDRLQELLDQFAYTIAPQSVIGEHSSGNDPWENALDMVTSAAEVRRLRNAVNAVVALTRSTDGDDLDPDCEVPVGEFQRVLAEHLNEGRRLP
jgi:hypothetical protein